MADFEAAIAESIGDMPIRCGDAWRRTMPPQGRSCAAVGAPLQAIWWFKCEGTLYSTVRLDLSIRDAEPTSALEIELWAQEVKTGGGIRLAHLAVAPVAGIGSPSLNRMLVVASGCPSIGWGVTARMTTGAPRQLMFSAVLTNCAQGSGVVWLGEGVTSL